MAMDAITWYSCSCGTVAFVVLGQFSDIYGPSSCGTVALKVGPQVSENWPRTIRDTVPHLGIRVRSTYSM